MHRSVHLGTCGAIEAIHNQRCMRTNERKNSTQNYMDVDQVVKSATCSTIVTSHPDTLDTRIGVTCVGDTLTVMLACMWLHA